MPVDRGDAVLAAPDEVGIEPDHREAAADRAAFDGFEQEGRALPAVPQLQEGRDRRQQIADEGRAQNAGLAGLVGRGEGVEIGRDRHGLQFAAGRLPQGLLVDRHAEILAHLGDVLADQVVAEAGRGAGSRRSEPPASW